MNNRSLSIDRKDMLLFVAFIILTLFSIIKKANIMFTICFATYLAVLFLALKNYRRNIVLCSFLITLFAFLYGSPVATLLLGSTYDVHFSDEAKHHFYFALFLSTLFVALGYKYSLKVRFNGSKKETSESMRLALRKICKYVFYFTYALKAIQYLEIGYYVIRFGYMFFYTQYQSAIPLIVEKISDLYIVAFSIYIATGPTKKESKPVITIFLIGGILSIITGKRYEFVYVMLMYFIYTVLNNEGSTEESRLDPKRKRKMLLMILAVPLLIIFLMYIGSARSQYTFELTSVSDTILDFMVDVGNSGKVIMRGYEYRDVIPGNRLYSFGSIIEYFKYNLFSEKVLGVTVPDPRTVEYVKSGHSFAYAITYYFSADNFFSGHGQGSSYIAELFADFGYLGIIIGSFALGWFIRQFFIISRKSVLHDAFMFFLIRPLLFIPRDTYCLPISYLINLKYLAAFAFIFMLAQHQAAKNN